MTRNALGREAGDGRALNGDFIADRRAKAVVDFMLIMQFRRDLRDARQMVEAAYPGQGVRLDADITTANVALRDAVLELEASR